jgi:ABC-type uncharacterized transport system permease subunit
MLYPMMNILAAGLYFAAGALILRRLLKSGGGEQSAARTGVLALATGAAILHGALLYSSLWINGGLNLALTSAGSLLACVVVVLFILVSLSKPIENLGFLILPVAGIAVLLAWLWPGEHMVVPGITSFLLTHLVIAFLAYSLLSLAVVQALLLAWQEHRLRHKHPGRLMRAMPPIQTMEGLLFQMITVGFLLLTLTLITGTLFSEQLFGKPLVLSHHIVLSMVAWIAFGVLLLGRWRFGWRGRNAVLWTLGGFFLLLLAYFGSKFVVEILLKR